MDAGPGAAGRTLEPAPSQSAADQPGPPGRGGSAFLTARVDVLRSEPMLPDSSANVVATQPLVLRSASQSSRCRGTEPDTRNTIGGCGGVSRGAEAVLAGSFGGAPVPGRLSACPRLR